LEDNANNKDEQIY